LAGTIDYGWYFTQQVRVLSIARDAARQGAADGADPEGVAEAVAVVLFDHSGIDCGRLLCTVDSSVDGSLPVDTLRVTVRADFDPLAGMLYFGTEDGLPLVPAGLSATAVFPLLD
jgi:Flp pilus assembly protein TadG